MNQEKETKSIEEKSNTKNTKANIMKAGLLFIVVGLALGVYFIGRPIYIAINKSSEIITLNDKFIMISIFFVLIGVALVIFKEKILDFIPTEADQKINMKHILYFVVLLAVFFLINSQIMSYLESLGYTEETSY